MGKYSSKHRFIMHMTRMRVGVFLKRPSILMFYLRYYVIIPLLVRIRQGKERRRTVTIVSYPKSGRTWLEALLVEVVRIRRGSPDGSETTLREFLPHLGDLPFIDFTHAGSSWESHALTGGEILATGTGRWAKGKVIFLYRDPLDTLVSCYYHLIYRSKMGWIKKEDLISNPVVGIDKLIDFMNLWGEFASRQQGMVMVVRYEDLRKDPARMLMSICDFIGMGCSPGEAEKAVERARFERMQEKERSADTSNPWLMPGNRSDMRSFKVRSGRVGESKEFFSPEELQQLDVRIESRLKFPPGEPRS